MLYIPRLFQNAWAGLVRLHKLDDVSDSDITSIIDNTYSLQDTKGINRVIDRISTANDPGNFKGAAFEVEYATSRSIDDIIEMGADSGIGQPGDIDLIMREGYKKVGYELKDIDYSDWTKYQNKFANQNVGLKKLVEKETIDDYTFMFKDKPPQDMINWLDSKNIPWDFV